MELAVQEKFEYLESVLGQFIVQTNTSLSRLEKNISALSIELREQDERFKAEIREQNKMFKAETREMDKKFKKETWERDEKFKKETQERDEKFRKEMDEFKDEMREFRNGLQADQKKMNKKWGELANKMGTIVEDIVAPSLRGIAREYFNVEEFDNFYVRNRRKNPSGDGRREFDVVAYTRDYLFIVETKSTPRTSYIHDFINFIPQIPLWFPESAGKAIIPIFASLYLEPDSISFLSKNNILALGMKDENMDLLNPDVRQYLLHPQSTGE
ncbi:MAG: hypothetical protein R6U68_13745 [Desulfobacteraceae bacterium]